MRRAGAALAVVGGMLLLAGVVGSLPAHATVAGGPKANLAGEGDSWNESTVNAIESDAATNNVVGGLHPTYLDANAQGEIGDQNDFVTGTNTDFVVTDEPLSSTQLTTATQNGLTPAYVPYALGPVDIVANLTDDLTTHHLLGPLQFSMKTLVDIFTHNVQTWTDKEVLNDQTPAVQNELTNYQMKFGQQQIVVTVPTNETPTTLALTAAFLADPTSAPTWKIFASSLGVTNPDQPQAQWPSDKSSSDHFISVSGGSAIYVQQLASLDRNNQPTSIPAHAIGFIGPAWAAQDHMSVAAVKNLAGKFVTPTAAAVQAAVPDSSFDASQGLYKISAVEPDYTTLTDPAAWPLPLASYLLVPKSGADPAKETAIAGLANFALGAAGQTDVTNSGLAPVTAAGKAAGTAVAAAVLAGATTTTSSSSTSSSSTSSSSTSTSSTSSTSTTVAGSTTTTTHSTSGGSPTTVARAGGTGSSDPSAQLPVTGVASWTMIFGGLGLLCAGDVVRRRARRSPG